MVKLYTAFTKEIDDPEAAVREICEQLNPAENALKNTVGIIHFYYEFAEEDTCRLIADALPFELVGCVSSYIGNNKEYGDVVLSVTMITSDEVRFSVKTIGDLDTKSQEQIENEITGLCTELCVEEMPKMMMPFLTPLQQFSGDELVETVNRLPNPIPLFGTVAFNTEMKPDTNFVMGNNKISPTMYAFVALYGNITPKFRITTAFAFEDSFVDVAEVTDADGPTLRTVNGMPVLDYLKKQGMVNADNTVVDSGVWAVPAILTYPNGMKVVRAFLGIVEGTEHIFATGKMSIGAKIMFAFLSGEKTLASAEKLMKELTEKKENDVIAYSCAARAWALGAQFFAETQKIAECAEEYQQTNDTPLNYCVAYSGGEICPEWDNDGKMINVLHNYTLVSCALH